MLQKDPVTSFIEITSVDLKFHLKSRIYFMLIHQNFHLYKTCISISRHSVRDHSSESNNGFCLIPKHFLVSLTTSILVDTSRRCWTFTVRRKTKLSSVQILAIRCCCTFPKLYFSLAYSTNIMTKSSDWILSDACLGVIFKITGLTICFHLLFVSLFQSQLTLKRVMYLFLKLWTQWLKKAFMKFEAKLPWLTPNEF